ncbi:MAG: serine/threonine protein kinase [Candidatus Riflebacteria bacterium]|nr:serine/threonine protein kinase [Candidatus Riflebacteria bacterium]
MRARAGGARRPGRLLAALFASLSLALVPGPGRAQAPEDRQALFATYPQFEQAVGYVENARSYTADEAVRRAQMALATLGDEGTGASNYRARRALIELLVGNPRLAQAFGVDKLRGELTQCIKNTRADAPGEDDFEEIDSALGKLPGRVAEIIDDGRPPRPTRVPRPAPAAGQRSAANLPLMVAVLAVVLALGLYLALGRGRPARTPPVPADATILGAPAVMPPAPRPFGDTGRPPTPLSEAKAQFRDKIVRPTPRPAPKQLTAEDLGGIDPDGQTVSIVLDATRSMDLAEARAVPGPEPRPAPSPPRAAASPPAPPTLDPAPVDPDCRTVSIELGATQALNSSRIKAIVGEARSGSGAAAAPAASGELLPPYRPTIALEKRRPPAQPSESARVQVDVDLLPARYKVLSILGRGGMGIVYKALDRTEKREVAIKTLGREVMETPTAKERFIREFEVLYGLDHPNIVKVYDVGCISLPFFVMEYIDGDDLGTVLLENTLSPALTLEVGIQLANALDYAHRHGLLHRDIKPSNLMATSSGLVKIVDFGLVKDTEAARLTQDGTVLGSLRFMAPEQLLAKEVDGRADIYAVGATLYYLLTGTTPFEGLPPAMKVTQEAPSILKHLPGLSGEFAAILMRCLRKSPADRYRSAHEVDGVLRATKL